MADLSGLTHLRLLPGLHGSQPELHQVLTVSQTAGAHKGAEARLVLVPYRACCSSGWDGRPEKETYVHAGP